MGRVPVPRAYNTARGDPMGARDAQFNASVPGTPGCDNCRRRKGEAEPTMALLPREGKFFDFFNEHAELAAKAAVELQSLLADLSQLEQRSRAIEKNEKKADQITHQTVQ